MHLSHKQKTKLSRSTFLRIVRNTSDNEVESDGDTDNETEANITHNEALMLLDRIKAYACKEGMADLLSKTADSTNLIQDHICSKKTKQTAIDDYFKRQS